MQMIKNVNSGTNQELIGASLSEPHINGTALREIYVYIYNSYNML